MPSNSKVSLYYRDAGVDIDAGDALVEAIKPFAKRTMRPEVLAGIGGFGFIFWQRLECRRCHHLPIALTQGVGSIRCGWFVGHVRQSFASLDSQSFG